MSQEKRNFDRGAGSWDDNPVRVKLSRDLFRAISGRIALTPAMDMLDFGCGTGLVTLRFQPHVRSITGVDSSRGMLDQFDKKIAELKLTNVRTALVDLDRGDTLTGSYDLVTSHMTLHHVKHIEPLFAQFHHIAAPGGHLCVADLDLDGGKFHDDNTGVFHFGFDRDALRRVFTKAGFVDVRDGDAAEVVRPGGDAEIRRFTVFIMSGRKPVNVLA